MEFEEYKKILAERIKALRKERNMSQEEMAEKLGTNHTHVVRMEKGTQDFRLSSLLKIADALEVEIGDLLTL